MTPGKNYVLKGFGKTVCPWTCLFIAPNGDALCVSEKKTGMNYLINKTDVPDYEEYKEPVVHKRYVHWYKDRESGNIWTSSSDKSEPGFGVSSIHLQTDMITYTEK